jgi:hypothetical protein
MPHYAKELAGKRCPVLIGRAGWSQKWKEKEVGSRPLSGNTHLSAFCLVTSCYSSPPKSFPVIKTPSPNSPMTSRDICMAESRGPMETHMPEIQIFKRNKSTEQTKCSNLLT